MATVRVDADVIVVGGGPGGATAAAALAMDGRRVILLERERFPRYHIGESLLPATVQGVCRFLGVGRELARAGFMRKYGATFRWGPAVEPWHVGFAEAMLGAGPKGAPVHAYQVERSKFDAILLANARRRGVSVRQGWRVIEAVNESGRVCGVVARDPQGRTRALRAHYVIDASGQSGVLATKIGCRDYDKFFRNIAVFGYFTGGGRQRGALRGNVISAAFGDGWIWYIPLSDRVTSVGAVVRREAAGAIARVGPAAALDGYIRSCPLIARYLEKAARVTRGRLSGTRIIKDYSYSNRTVWTPGAAFVGDAALFVDPLFSSGVHLATYAGLLAARSINTALGGTIDEATAFDEFSRRYYREFRLFYEFLFAFYEAHLDESSAFWTARKLLNIPDAGPREALVRLLTGLGQAEGEPIAGAAGVLRALEHQTRFLRGTMSDRTPAAATTRARKRHLEAQMRERVDLWRSGGTARVGRRGTPRPLFEGGLVPTADGLRWQRAQR